MLFVPGNVREVGIPCLFSKLDCNLPKCETVAALNPPGESDDDRFRVQFRETPLDYLGFMSVESSHSGLATHPGFASTSRAKYETAIAFVAFDSAFKKVCQLLVSN